MPVSASPFMTSLLFSPDPRFKPHPRILSTDSVLPALTLFLSPDHRLLLSHWVCKMGSQSYVGLLPPNDHTEELKFTFLILSQILKRPGTKNMKPDALSRIHEKSHATTSGVEDFILPDSVITAFWTNDLAEIQFPDPLADSEKISGFISEFCHILSSSLSH
ncbi:hypothetical protein ATANTOWER_030234 [Ataeniobius toweri]|uniref:Uncharacterized protein n=1 Tax=Ataeniobius toweri TaxID=208326 RepID=A0ABU7BP47_9TELE|nr:hypothetical protein [Ataeniobius toweri]